MAMLKTLMGAAMVALVAGVGGPANAGLQKWSVLYLDAKGNPTTYARAKSAEAYAYDARGYHIAIGCAPDGGHSIAVGGPDDQKARFAKIDEIEPSLRVGKPGTDLFLGPIGALHFDGKRYVGRIPESALDPLRKKVRDGLVTFTELNSHTTIKLKTTGVERALNEVSCK